MIRLIALTALGAAAVVVAVGLRRKEKADVILLPRPIPKDLQNDPVGAACRAALVYPAHGP